MTPNVHNAEFVPGDAPHPSDEPIDSSRDITAIASHDMVALESH